MNLDQIATKCFILALFIRDDGQRLLLGDGYYDFNQKLQHFQANTIANDIVELQGDNGQLLAGQVMRSGAQKFEGYVGDATTNRQNIEQKRSDFMAFFRIKHFYKVVYIFPDGTAIQRQRGYLTDAPTIPEIFQKFPEYSIALNFEDANYYEYAEDEYGDEIYAHIIELALAGGATGGLVWDAIGAVSNGITWSGIQTAQGEYIQITNALDIPAKLASVEMLGKAEQDGTPTPDAPVAVETVTGENVVKIEGKNLFNQGQYTGGTNYGITTTFATEQIKVAGTTDGTHYPTYIMYADGSTTQAQWWATASAINTSKGQFTDSGTYTLSIEAEGNISGHANGFEFILGYMDGTISSNQFVDQTTKRGSFTATKPINFIAFGFRPSLTYDTTFTIQLEKGSSVSSFESYHGQEFEIFLPPDTLDYMIEQGGFTNQGLNTVEPNRIRTKNYIPVEPNTQYTMSVASWNTSIGDGTPNFSVSYYSTDDYTTPRLSNKGWTAFSTPATFTTPANCHFVRVLFNIGGYLPITPADMTGIRIRGGNLSTPIELAKIGNYQDRIYKNDGKWYIHRAVRHLSLPFADMNNSDNYPGWKPLEVVIEDLGNSLNNPLANFTTYKTNIAGQNIGIGINTNSPNKLLYLYKASFGGRTQTQLKTDYPNLVAELYYGILEANQYDEEITNETLIAQLDALESASLYVGVNNIGTETLNALPTLKIEYYTEVDLDGAGYEWEPGGNTAKTIVTVAGVDSAWPIWTVQGGAQNPTLTNITTGQTITWQGFVPEGQTLTINMAEMTADLAGANVFEYITGEWIRLAPGNNTLVYTAGSADKPSTLSWNGVLA